MTSSAGNVVTSTGDGKSKYFEGLDEGSKARYQSKINHIGNVDPYTIARKDWSADPKILPAISYPDIVNYVLFSPCPYRLEDMRSYIGLEAYNQFVSGWVREVVAWKAERNLVIVSGRVMHSQRLQETALHPWVIAQKDGKIISAHCNCMAGLGETCTHVCSLLFYTETKVRIRDSVTVTQEAAYWKMPATVKKAQYLPLHQIDFTSSKSKKRKLDDSVSNTLTPLISDSSQPISAVATEWGCSHESEARENYADIMMKNHDNCSVFDSGLVLNDKYPYIGASPDGRVTYDCCGEGVLEIKCPFCAKDKTTEEYALQEKSSCLEKMSDGVLKLKRDHTYAYQVQTQLGICEVDYADFVVWTSSDLHMERIRPDEEIWEQIKVRSAEFFQESHSP
ncbi:hypothetical protein HOLleu_25248 [Holothuria leucospilota]|uniref:YqaJ viral recombinase domain-containing protein n=1 Tax=Holothuria leucospilota TaxID=206669 RepID=A0A9Q1BRR7_HOLLE|nr:hypothetical protein HOLleu_25248 [Holothuria leucospilota]